MFKEAKYDFTAIDFETANAKHESICQIGLVRVENGKIIKELNILVQPPNNEYHWGNSRVHGIKSKHTINAPTFDQVWDKIEPYVFRKKIVAHNAPFDVKCLQKVLMHYDLEIPPFYSDCTVKIYKRNLAALCEQFDIELNHHDALSDAKACAKLYLKHLNSV